MAFLGVPIITSPDFGYTNLWNIEPFRRDFLTYFLVLACFYLYYFYVIPQFYFTRRVLEFSAVTVVCFLLVSFLPSLVIPNHHHEFQEGKKLLRPHHQSFLFEHTHYFFLFLVMIFFSLMMKINNRWKQTEKEKMEVELSFLKAQINPHFLFNTLNSIYSLALEKSEHTATAVVKLSAMMRYVTTEAHNNFVSLEKEINYIASYIELQRIRLGNTVKINFTLKGNAEGKEITPLILIPFVENAFKHGVNPEEKSFIEVNIHIENSELQLGVINNKVHERSTDDTPSGFGLRNTMHRLNLLYGGKHTLTVNDEANDFSILLKLKLN